MHTIIHRHNHSRFPNPASTTQDFRSPHYECLDLPQSLKLAVYVPGVDAGGIELTGTAQEQFEQWRGILRERYPGPAPE